MLFMKRGYETRFSVKVQAGIIGDNVVVSYLLPERFIAQRNPNFL
jgi:hypothetical protein